MAKEKKTKEQKEREEKERKSAIDQYGAAFVYTGSNEEIKNSDEQKKARAASDTWKNKKAGQTGIKLTESGAIEITVPKGIADSKEFKEQFDTKTIEALSQRYRLNKDYKVPYTQLNDDGSKTTTEVTIPEYIEKMDEALRIYTRNAYKAQLLRNEYAEKYGDKAQNMSDDLIAMSASTYDENAKALVIPEFMRNQRFFDGVRDKINENGEISVDDFNKIYNLDNFSKEDIVDMMAMLNGHLEGSEWSDKEYYLDEDGNKIYNRENIKEMAKALALVNYIQAHDPDGKWYQKLGYDIGAAATNFGYQFQDFALKMLWVDAAAEVLDWGVGKVNGGKGTGWHEWKEKNEAAVDLYNEQAALMNDGTKLAGTLGAIGGGVTGIVAGAWLQGKAAKATVGAIASKVSKAVQSAEEAAKAIKMAQAVSESGNTYLGTKMAIDAVMNAKNIQNIAVGASVAWNSMTLGNKVKTAASVAKTFSEKHKMATEIGKFLLDTVHDAILYDTHNLLEVLDASDKETRDYWLGQMGNNAILYVPIRGGSKLIKVAGKTTPGKAVNAFTSKYINRAMAWGYDRKLAAKNKFAGGDLKQKLVSKYEKAKEAGKTRKARHLAEKINQLDFADLINQERRKVGQLDLEYDGFLKLSEKSEKKWLQATIDYKATQNSVDIFHRQVQDKRTEMIGLVRDPATGKMNWINPTLGGANDVTTSFYLELAKAAQKEMGDAVMAEDSFLTQDLLDYMMGSADLKRYEAIANGGGVDADKAADAAKQCRENIEALKDKIPENLRNLAQKQGEVYATFYGELNRYGVANKLLDADEIEGYNNETWKQAGGYQPIIKDHGKSSYKMQRVDGTYDTYVDNDMDKLTYHVEKGQHYKDPEMVRQRKINDMAKLSINRELLDNYTSRVGVSMSEIVTGEQTKFVKKVKAGRKTIQREVDFYFNSMAEYSFSGEFVARKGAGVKLPTEQLKGSNLNKVVASMSDADVNAYLVTQDLLVSGAKADSWTSTVTDEESFQAFYGNLNRKSKNYLKSKLSEFNDGEGDDLTYNNFLRAKQAYGNDLEKGIRRSFVAGDANFANSNTAKYALTELKKGNEAFLGGYTATEATAKLRGIKGIDTDDFVKQITQGSDEFLNEFSENLRSSKGFMAALGAYAEDGVAPESVADYYILQKLQGKEELQKAYDMLDKRIEAFEGYGELKSKDADFLKKKAHELYKDTLDTRADDARKALDSLGGAPIDEEKVFEEVKRLTEEIEGLQERIDLRGTNNRVITYIDGNGRQAYATVDPAFASLYNKRFAVEKSDPSLTEKLNAGMSTVFRKGTTSYNVASWGNQMFRDYGSALMMGGAWKTIKGAADELRQVFGDDVIDQLKEFDPDGYEIVQLKALAKQTGQDIDAAAISRELMIGSSRAPSSTEVGLYRQLWDSMRDDENKKLDDMQEGFRDKLRKLDPDNLVNAKREEYLRNRVYANNLNDALKQGYSLKQARTYAEFAMNNATTNFGRQLYHMQAISDTTPYFRAAINGHKSFWRMWSIDPVGISGRVMGGLIIPSMALIAHSLADKENREVYKNIPEYQKNTSLVFVVRGEIIAIPFPQELASIVAPFRQFVEHLYDVDKYTFSELATNNLLGFSPIDLTGFSLLDVNRMGGDPTLLSQLGRGTSRVFSQIAPVPLKTTYMLVTGIDPYTGNNLNDPSYRWYDPETGSVELMDYSQSHFARVLANTGLLGKNAEVWASVISGVFGKTGADVIDDITALFVKDGGLMGKEGLFETAANNLGSALSSPITVNKYNLVNSQWRQAVRQLEAEKQSILTNDEVKVLLSRLSSEKDPEERKKIMAQLNNYTDEYNEHVKTTCQRLTSMYHGSFDRHKFASVVQLLNFNTDPTWQNSMADSNDSSSAFYSGRDAAYQLMSQMDLKIVDDLSVFGYLTTDRNGNPVVRYTEPLAILDASNTLSNADEYHLANIKAMVSTAGLWDKHDIVKERLQPYYDKKNLSKQERKEMDNIMIEWDAEVAKVLADYASRYSAEAAINNEKVRDYLYNLIEVPSSWEVNAKGKPVSLGEQGNKKKAYYDSWVKKLFGVNDPYKGQY